MENLVEKKYLQQFVDQFVKRIRQTGSLLDKATHSHARPVRSTENIAAVAQSVLKQPSTRHRSQNLNISRTSLRRILNKDLVSSSPKWPCITFPIKP